MRDKRRSRTLNFQLESMEERAVTSSMSLAQFNHAVAMQRAIVVQRAMAAARANAVHASVVKVAQANRFGPATVGRSTVQVSSSQASAARQSAVVSRPTQTVAPASQATVIRPQAANGDISDVKNGPLAKAGQQLINLYLDYQAFVQGGSDGTFHSTHASNIQVVGTSVRVDVRGTGGASATASALTNLGMKIESTDARTGVVEGLLPIAQLPNAAQLSQVTQISPVFVPVHR